MFYRGWVVKRRLIVHAGASAGGKLANVLDALH